MTRLAREAFGRLGVRVEVTALPGERALINANAGLDDGDLLRIPGLEKDYPNLVRVPEKVMEFEFVAYTRDPAIRIQSIADLKPYTVAYATGWKFYEASVTEAADFTRVRDLPELFLLLKAGRVEVVLADHWQGMWAARAVGVDVIPQSPPFRVSDMNIYLNRRHSALVPRLAERRSVRIEMADGQEGVAQADQLRLRQVVINLLSNAIKYNKPEGTVSIRVRRQDPRRVYIGVTDSGCGIQAADLERLFQPFERLAAEHEPIEGTGIGLALSRRLTELMGGEIGVESEADRGSTFRVTLPEA